MRPLTTIVAFVLAFMMVGPAVAQERGVQVGGVNAVLLGPAKPRASVILLAGGDGNLGITADGRITTDLEGSQLVRTRAAYAARGFAVLVPDDGVDLAQAVAYMAAIRRPVAVIGTSRGTQRAARGIARGARPDRLVLTSGFLSDASGDDDNVETILGSPSALPPTLVIHNRWDKCNVTMPEGVDPFIAWSAGRAKVTWLQGGIANGRPCGGQHYHGFNGLDGQVVAAAAAFVR